MPFGTVPVYEAFTEAVQAHEVGAVGPEAVLEAVESHARDGVDFVTVHVGVTREVVAELRRRPRLCGVVSRGGMLLGEWMRLRDEENPLFERYDDLLDIAHTYDVTLSLGDGLRPGALADAGDPAQVRELVVVADLVRRARAAGVQVMVEGPGHVPLSEVEAQVREDAAATGRDAETLLGQLREGGAFDALRADLRLQRAVDILIQSATPIPLETAQAREKLWTPGSEAGEAAGPGPRLWTPSDPT